MRKEVFQTKMKKQSCTNISIIFVCLSSLFMNSSEGDTNFYHIKEGDVYVAALFPLHEKNTETSRDRCGNELYPSGVLLSTIFLQTVKQFESLTGRYENVTKDFNLGFILIDTCLDLITTTYEVGKLMKGEYGIEPDKILLVLGPMMKPVTITVTGQLEGDNIPQVGYNAAINDLKSDVQYRNYFCTAPSSVVESSTILSMCEYMGWTRAVIVYAEDAYGITLNETITALAEDYGICIMQSIGFHSLSTQEITTLLLNEKQHRPFDVVLLLVHRSNAEDLLQYMKYGALLQDELILFGSCNWGNKAGLVEDMYGTNKAILGMSYDVDHDFEIDKYLDSFPPNDTEPNPLWTEYYQTLCECTLFNDTTELPICDSSIGITKCHGYSSSSKVPFTKTATILSIQAIYEAYHHLCSDKPTSECTVFKENGRQVITQKLKELVFEGQKMFTDKGDSSAGRRVISMLPRREQEPDISVVAKFKPLEGLEVDLPPYLKRLRTETEHPTVCGYIEKDSTFTKMLIACFGVLAFILIALSVLYCICPKKNGKSQKEKAVAEVGVETNDAEIGGDPYRLTMVVAQNHSQNNNMEEAEEVYVEQEEIDAKMDEEMLQEEEIKSRVKKERQ